MELKKWAAQHMARDGKVWLDNAGVIYSSSDIINKFDEEWHYLFCVSPNRKLGNTINQFA